MTTAAPPPLEYKLARGPVWLNGQMIKAGFAFSTPPSHTAITLAEVKRQFDTICREMDAAEAKRAAIKRLTPHPGPGEAVWRELAAGDLPLLKRDYADDALEHACEALRMNPREITLAWVRKETTAEVRERDAYLHEHGRLQWPIHVKAVTWAGWTQPYPAVIYVGAEYPYADLGRIIAHETRHRWQYSAWGRKDLHSAAEAARYEADADTFADSLGYFWSTDYTRRSA